MTEHQRYSLDSSKALIYLQENLEETNALSSAIFKYVNFEKGVFYTILQENITNKQLYGFRWGGVGGGIRNRVCDILFTELHDNSRFTCIFDDVNGTYEPSYDEPSFLKVGAHYKDEIYYIIERKEASKDFLIECLRTSNACWHSLCVLSKKTYSRNKDLSITETDIIDFAKTSDLILIGAYDGEGYIFWKRK